MRKIDGNGSDSLARLVSANGAGACCPEAVQRTSSQGLSQLIQTGQVQTKLKVSKPSDKMEQEADQTADRVMTAPIQQVSHIQSCSTAIAVESSSRRGGRSGPDQTAGPAPGRRGRSAGQTADSASGGRGRSAGQTADSTSGRRGGGPGQAVAPAPGRRGRSARPTRCSSVRKKRKKPRPSR